MKASWDKHAGEAIVIKAGKREAGGERRVRCYDAGTISEAVQGDVALLGNQ